MIKEHDLVGLMNAITAGGGGVLATLFIIVKLSAKGCNAYERNQQKRLEKEAQSGIPLIHEAPRAAFSQ